VLSSATATQTWRRDWLRMWRQRRPAMPRPWTEIVRAARGVYARGRFRRITRLGWPPLVRLTIDGPCRPAGRVHGVPRRL
jgi:hypothetical protein